MINAFTPKQIVNLPNKHKIDCILAYGDRLLLSLSNGDLQVYSITDPFSPNLSAQLLTTYSSFTKRPVEKLGVVKDAGSLIALADSIIHVFDLETFSLAEQLTKTKGANTFAIHDGVHNDSMVSRLIVACKRKLYCYTWRDSEFTSQTEAQLPDRVKTLTFLDHDLVLCGLGTGDYCLFDINSNSALRTITPGAPAPTSYASVGISYIGIGTRQVEPLSVRLFKDGTALLVKDTQSYLLKGPLLKHNEELDSDLRDVEVQPFKEDQEIAIDWPGIPEILGFSYPYLIAVIPSKGCIEVRNPKTMSLYQTLEIDQVKLINDGKLFYSTTNNQVYRLLSVDYEDQIQQLVNNSTHNNNSLREAISLLNQIEPVLLKDKHGLLRELQMMNAKQMFFKKQFQESLTLFSDISAPPQLVIELYPDDIDSILEKDEVIAELDEGDEQDDTEEYSNWSKQDWVEAIKALLPYLADTRRKIATLSVSHEKIKYRGYELSEKIYGEDLQKSATLVDTTLFQCYIKTRPSLVGPLVRVHNNCDPSVVEKMLSKLGKWKELVDFYFGKSLHAEALELLKKLADGDNQQLKGPEPTVRYLQRLNNDHIDLICEFATWPISINEEHGVELFLEDSSESQGLNRQKVLKFMQETLKKFNLTTKYLEYLINDMDESGSVFHESLAMEYIQHLKSTDDEPVWTRLIEFISNSTHYRPQYILRELPDDSKLLPVKAILLGKLNQHEKVLRLYTFDMENHTAAREYCWKLYERDLKAGQESLHLLLSLYLRPPYEGYSKPILDLLSSQGSRMSAVQVIQSLPSDTKVIDIDAFLQSQLRSLTSAVKEGQLATNLRKVNLIRTQEQLLELGNKHAVITNLRTCKECMKRLGHSVISMFPNGTVVHYGCAKQYKENLAKEAEKLKPVILEQRYHEIKKH